MHACLRALAVACGKMDSTDLSDCGKFMNTAFTIRYATELALRVCIFNDIFCYFLHEELPLYFRSVNVKCEFLSMEVGQLVKCIVRIRCIWQLFGRRTYCGFMVRNEHLRDIQFYEYCADADFSNKFEKWKINLELLFLFLRNYLC